MLPPEQYSEELKEWYFSRTGNRLNLDNPKTYNEKIQWFKLYGVTPQIRDLCDKYRVRSYVASKIGEEYLVPLIGKWKYPEEIDFSVLPEKFVIKANHGCKYNYIVTDKSKVDIEDFCHKANKWLQQDYAFYSGFEMQYHGIDRCLIGEAYLENQAGELYDYKVWCFNGRAEFIEVIKGRGEKLTIDFYDREWRLQSFTHGYPNNDIPCPCPDNLDEMIAKAEVLAADFPHVRVDFYRCNDGKLYRLIYLD